MKKGSDVLKSLLENLVSGNEFVDLYSSWKSILGEDFVDISAHSEPVDIRNNALILYVDHPGWIQRIEFNKKKILKQLNSKYPHVNNIFIQKVQSEKFLEYREMRIMGNYK